MHLANLRSSIEHLQTMRTYDLDWLDNQHVTDRKRILEGITPEDNVHKDNAHKVTQAHKKCHIRSETERIDMQRSQSNPDAIAFDALKHRGMWEDHYKPCLKHLL